MVQQPAGGLTSQVVRLGLYEDRLPHGAKSAFVTWTRGTGELCLGAVKAKFHYAS